MLLTEPILRIMRSEDRTMLWIRFSEISIIEIRPLCAEDKRNEEKDTNVRNSLIDETMFVTRRHIARNWFCSPIKSDRN